MNNKLISSLESGLILSVSLWGGFAQAVTTDEIMRADQRIGISAVTNPLKASKVNDLEAIYDISDRELGGVGRSAIYLLVPDNFKSGTLDSMSLTHRQDPNEESSCGGDRDCNPAYISTEVYDSRRADHNWRYWGGAGSGPLNSKFAELRSSRGETDNLYEWQRKGHYAVNNQKDFSQDFISPALLRVRSVGKDEAHIQQVILKITPPRVAKQSDIIFARGLKFGDYITAQGRRYPGKPDRGDYGNALLLEARHRPRHENLDRSWNIERGSFRIPLQAGMKLVSIDIACGDMKPVPHGGDSERYRGNSYITVRRWVRGAPVEDLIISRNVGSNGVMRATSEKISRVVGSDEEIEIKADRGTISIMGIRLGAF